MSIIDESTGCTLHPDVKVGSKVTWLEHSIGHVASLVGDAPGTDKPTGNEVTRVATVIEIVDDDYDEWLLVTFLDEESGEEIESDLPSEWWDSVRLVSQT